MSSVLYKCANKWIMVLERGTTQGRGAEWWPGGWRGASLSKWHLGQELHKESHGHLG